jgi:hypothetical protein
LPLPEVEHGDDGGLPVLGRVAGDDGLHLFGVFFVELEGNLFDFVSRRVMFVTWRVWYGKTGERRLGSFGRLHKKAEGSGTDVGVVVIGIPVLCSPNRRKHKPSN